MRMARSTSVSPADRREARATRASRDRQDPKDPKTKVPLERMKKTYYRARGWDQNGIPTQRTLKKLKIIE